MIIKNTPVYFYIIASILAVIAMICDSEWLMLLTKPSIIPALFIYYITVNDFKIDTSLIIILLIYFISDVIALLAIEEATLYVMALDFIPYLLLLRVVIEDVFELRLYKIRKVNIAAVIFAFLSLMVAMYFLIDSFAKTNPEYVIPVIAYGIILALYISLSLYLYLVTDYDFAFNILIAATFALIADVIFVITNMIFSIEALNYLEFTLQIISYFFIVVYFIRRNIHRFENNDYLNSINEG